MLLVLLLTPATNIGAVANCTGDLITEPGATSYDGGLLPETPLLPLLALPPWTLYNGGGESRIAEAAERVCAEKDGGDVDPVAAADGGGDGVEGRCTPSSSRRPWRAIRWRSASASTARLSISAVRPAIPICFSTDRYNPYDLVN